MAESGLPVALTQVSWVRLYVGLLAGLSQPKI
jgi:hypothetical protein